MGSDIQPMHNLDQPNSNTKIQSTYLGPFTIKYVCPQVGQLRHTVDWVYSQLRRSSSYFSWWGAPGRSSFKKEAWKKYYRQMQEVHEEELERLERIKQMQSVFNRARNKRKSYETWTEYGPGAYHQHFNGSIGTRKLTQHGEKPRLIQISGELLKLENIYCLIIILSWDLTGSGHNHNTDAEIKTSFREKAKEYHPDQNHGNKEAAEAKFKEVMMSYEAIKLERKNGNP